MDIYNQLTSLSDILMVKCVENQKIYDNINNLSSTDMRSHILKFFVESSIKNARNVYVNKSELEMVTNPSFKVFNRSLSTFIGNARAHARLTIIKNIVLSSCFQEKDCSMIDVFSEQMKFTPTKNYLKKLHKIFPNHPIFDMVP